MKICRNNNKRTTLLVMIFLGYSLNYVFRTIVQLAIRINAFNEGNSTNFTTEFEQKAIERFYYGYLPLQIPCARLTEYFGGKTLHGLGLLAASTLSLAIPFSIQLAGHNSWLIVQLFLGMFLAPTCPAVFTLASKWIPVEERGKLISSSSALSLGSGLMMLMPVTFLRFVSTEVMFYAAGMLGVLYTVCWYYLVYDTPLVHPNITKEERNYIVLKKESQGTIYKGIDCPWLEIFFDPQVWVVFMTHTCYYVAIMFLMQHTSICLKEVFGLDHINSPVIISAPFISSFIAAFLSGFLFDFLYRMKIPVILIQRCYTLVGAFIPAIAMIGFISWRSCIKLTMVFYVVGCSFVSIGFGGYYTTCLDIAPNFAGTLTAISSTVANVGIILSTPLMNFLNEGLDNLQTWENRYSFISALLFTSGTIFSLFGDSQITDWNAPYEYEMV